MINSLEIKNFKSIKHLKLDCKKINIFIGKPNTGKSNILEGISTLSGFHSYHIKDFIRFEELENLFYDNEYRQQIDIRADDWNFTCQFGGDKFVGNSKSNHSEAYYHFEYNPDGSGSSGYSGRFSSPFKFYRFEVLDKFLRKDLGPLLPPKGENLLALLQGEKELRKSVSNLLSEFGLKLLLRSADSKLDLAKDVEYAAISYPYFLVSDTIQRLVFHLAAIDTNQNSIIIFEEPEAHAFPYYTKFLAERIALDETNQYFISTHNPYFLLSVLEKAPKDDIGIYITYLKKYQTKIKAIPEEKLPEILDLGASVFFNIEKFLEED